MTKVEGISSKDYEKKDKSYKKWDIFVIDQ